MYPQGTQQSRLASRPNTVVPFYFSRLQRDDTLTHTYVNRITEELTRATQRAGQNTSGLHDPLFVNAVNDTGAAIPEYSAVELLPAIANEITITMQLPSKAALYHTGLTINRVPDGATAKVLVYGWGVARVKTDPQVGDFCVVQKDSAVLLTLGLGHYRVLAVLDNVAWLPRVAMPAGMEWCIVSRCEIHEGIATETFKTLITDMTVLDVSTADGASVSNDVAGSGIVVIDKPNITRVDETIGRITIFGFRAYKDGEGRVVIE